MTVLSIPARDQQALDSATTRGLVLVPSPARCSELSPEQAVFRSLGRHLTRLEASLDDEVLGTTKALRFRNVRDEWPEAWEPSLYPIGVINSEITHESDCIVGKPAHGRDGTDIITEDGAWALWNLGEDVGDARVIIFAAYSSHAKALAQGVRDALTGDLDKRRRIVLPLPEAYLPPPFRTQFAVADFPVCAIALRGGGDNGADPIKSPGGAWRIDVRFTWQAPSLAARARIPDLVPILEIELET